ncbi:MAG: carbohydrate binding family 9 domain-containing protein [Gemmatimonadetes bacterium]|nr:carbohydrate binding family 9 domain-containing protein [Gemmatimonadota bacterium]
MTVALIALLGVPAALFAQQNSTQLNLSTAAPVATAVRAAPGAPVVDGRLDDPIWQAAPPITDFTQRDPHEGQPATERTEARVAYTDDALYVAIRAYDSHPEAIVAQLTRRDEESPSDWLVVGIDSYHDRRTAFVFFVNPAGVKRDSYLFDDNNEDDSWDAVWEVATTRDGEGWTAEFRIPFSQLRFPKRSEHQFGFNIYRKIARLNEEQFWRLPPKNQSGMVSRFGDLVGIERITPPRHVEVLPYAAAAGTFEPPEAGNPFRTGNEGRGRAGADLRVGVTSNLTLSATINPDFGQVEADPAVVNLTAFETFFPEKRPFFNEGLDVFRFPIALGDGDDANEQLFYTRRIGRAPHGSPDDRGGYAEDVTETTLTAEERADVVDAAGARFSDPVEPRSVYGAGRLARDFRNGLTQIGVFGTAVDRSLPPALADLRSSAYAGGLKWSHRFRHDTYSVNGWLVGTSVQGSPEAIDETQRSSARYFQRPDNDYVTYDRTRTSLSGFAGQFIFNKHAGGNWRFGFGVDTRSPGFEVNDIGYQREADRTIQFTWLNRRWLQPGKLFRRFNLNFNQWTAWTYGWDRLAVGGNLNVNYTLLNYWGGYFGINRESDGLTPGALRGGPAFLRPGGINGWGGFYSDDRKAFRLGLNGSFWRGDENAGWYYGWGPNVSWRPATNVDLRLSPSVSRNADRWQYLDTQDALGSTHYLFGELEQTTVNLTLRGNVTFTPDLSLQVYAQPFVASGDFTTFKQVSDPRAERFADRFDVFGTDRLIVQDGEVGADLDRNGQVDLDLGNPDFSYLSFRSNLVLRWEYLLGSTLFLVWQHGRGDSNHDGTFDLGSSLDQLFRSDARNTFVVKVNYWLSL